MIASRETPSLGSWSQPATAGGGTTGGRVEGTKSVVAATTGRVVAADAASPAWSSTWTITTSSSDGAAGTAVFAAGVADGRDA